MIKSDISRELEFLKILQINTVYKEKSTGRTCFEVKEALENSGFEGYVAYGRGKHNDKNTYRIGSEFEYYFHNIMARITGLQGYFSYYATKRLIRYIKQLSPDIIHLRNLHAYYLNYPVLFKFLKIADIPVVLNLHDCWAITGKCAHFTDIQCSKWKKQCYSCPVVKSYPKSYFIDQTKKLYSDKKKWFQDIDNLTVVGVSEWTSNQAKMSFLSKRKILTIYNWINREIFHPRREKSNYPIKDKFTILGVSSSWIVGSPRYEDFIKLSKLIPDDMQIVLIGQSDVVDFPKNIRHIPFVSDTNELAKLYSSADVYVHLSTEDTFGKVVAEAMACGTPAIVYNSTALPELIDEGCGYVVKKRDINGILKAIYLIKENGKNFYTDKCLLTVSKNFDYTKNTRQLLNLYNSIIN